MKIATLPKPDEEPGISPAPCDLELERALLAMVIADNAMLDDLAPLQPEDLYDHIHGAVLASALELRKEKRPVNLVTLRARFGQVPFPAGGSVVDYLGALSPNGQLPALADLVASLRELRLRRDMLSLGERIASMSWDQVAGPSTLLADAKVSLDALHAECAPPQNTVLTAAQAIDELMDRVRNGDQSQYVSSGFLDLDRMTGGFAKKNYHILAGRPGMGKELHIDEPILMANGTWKRNGDLRLGDRVASVDGAPSRVSGVFPQGKKQLYMVTFSDGRQVEAGADHLWLVHYRHWDAPRTLSTLKLISMLERVRYKDRLWIDRVNGVFGANRALPVDPYVLGALLANGSLSKGDGVQMTTPYEEVVSQVAMAIGDRGSVRPASKGITYGVCGTKQKNDVLDGLRKLGLMGLKSEHKFIPSEYLSADRTARANLLRGLLDGDGWVEKFGATRYATSSKRLADDIRALVWSLGGTASLAEKMPKYTHRGRHLDGLVSYVINIAFDGGCAEFLTVQSKRERTLSRVGKPRLTIDSIVPTRCAEAQCISVTHPSRLFVTKDYIVTHNTTVAVAFSARAARAGHGVLAFSLEMSRQQWMARVLADAAWQSTGSVAYSDALRSRLDEHQIRRFEAAAQERRDHPFFIDDSSGLKVTDIRQRIKRVRDDLAKDGMSLDMVVIDQLSKVEPTKAYRDLRGAYEEISKHMQQMAKDEDVALILLHQLSRGVEGRDNKRPNLADLRETGAIEQDADMVMFAFRQSYYLERQREDNNDQEQARQEALANCRNMLEIGIAKQRNGPTDTVDLYVDMAANAIRDKWRGG
jgi:replicative DNA helicase